jgi:hypothetical protein
MTGKNMARKQYQSNDKVIYNGKLLSICKIKLMDYYLYSTKISKNSPVCCYKNWPSSETLQS